MHAYTPCLSFGNSTRFHIFLALKYYNTIEWNHWKAHLITRHGLFKLTPLRTPKTWAYFSRLMCAGYRLRALNLVNAYTLNQNTKRIRMKIFILRFLSVFGNLWKYKIQHTAYTSFSVIESFETRQNADNAWITMISYNKQQ